MPNEDVWGYRYDCGYETGHVSRTKDQIKDTPEFERQKQPRDPNSLEQFAKYYGMPHM